MLTIVFSWLGRDKLICYSFFEELDWESVAAGLLHDTVEDTDVVTFERIEKEFGATVRRIVEGETKVVPQKI